ncbi:MAG: hypothetical protein Q6M04_15155, partial [Thermostichus sp. BF3_bins_97]
MLEHLQVDRPRKLVSFWGEPVIFHCHHYNLFLQQTIEDPDWIDGISILRTSAQEIFYSLLQEALAQRGTRDPQACFQVAAEIFAFLGFGRLEITGTAEGGEVKLYHSHYAEGWLGKYGEQVNRTKPIDHLAVGYAAALFDAVFGELGRYVAEETHCIAVTQGEHCLIQVVPAAVPRRLTPSPQMGQ